MKSVNSKLSNTQKGKGKSKQSSCGGDDDGVEVPIWSGFVNLPRAIVIDILLRLPIKSILICKFVSKSWKAIISDPEFAKLQFQSSKVHLMLRTNVSKHVSRTLFLVEVEPHNLNHRPCNCETSDDVFDAFHNHVHINFDTKFNIPLRDAQKVLDEMLANDLKVNSERKLKPYFAARPKFDKFGFVNSCNGFVCLSKANGNPVVVCNPITGEFAKLAKAPKFPNFGIRVHSGLGFSPNANQYKVVRMYSNWDYDPRIPPFCEKAEVYTLGKGSWKAIEGPPDPLGTVTSGNPIYLNGAIHWFSYVYFGFYWIITFDFETERFHKLPLPHSHQDERFHYDGLARMSIGVLRGNLCLCDRSNLNIDTWVMEDYGVQESWVKTYSIRFGGDRHLVGIYNIIKCYENGGLLMSHSRNYLVYLDIKNSVLRYFKICGSKSRFEAFTHAPSLISLKDVLAGDELEVLNVNSRCGRLKLREDDSAFWFEERKVLFGPKKDRKTAEVSDASSSSSSPRGSDELSATGEEA